MSALDAVLAFTQGLGIGVGLGVAAVAIFVAMVPIPQNGRRFVIAPADGPAHRAAGTTAVAGPVAVPPALRPGGAAITRYRRVPGQHRLRRA